MKKLMKLNVLFVEHPFIDKMEYKTRIEFNEEELEVLVSWIFMDDAKLKNAIYKL